jgi:hypothetical protein
MRYWFDTEFIEDGKTIDLISIGIVAEDGRELYLLNVDCDWSKASQWVKDNVLASLPPKPSDFEFSEEHSSQGWIRHSNIKDRIHLFVGGDVEWQVNEVEEDGLTRLNPVLFIPESLPKPEFWAYYADYDWITFCQLFGTMMELPQGFPMYCRDLNQTIDELGCPDIPKQTEGEHNALNDARWTRDTWLWLRDRYRHPGFGNYPVEQLRIQAEALA